MTDQERQERMEKLFEKMLNMEMTNREMYEQCRNVAHEPMTNEEWLHSLNTEQLADAFFEYRYANATPRQKLWMSASEECIKTDIVKWLKQQHHSKE